MAGKSSEGSSVGGGRRGGHVSSTMDLAGARKLQKTSSSKPNLGTAKLNQSKVTNKPKSTKGM